MGVLRKRSCFVSKEAVMGVDGGGGGEKDKVKGKKEREEQDGVSVHSPCKAPPSSASSVPKEQSQVELELKLLEALEVYPPVKLRCRFGRHFTPDEVLQLLDQFYNLEMLKPDDEEMEILNHEEDFSLPQCYFDKEDS